MDEAVQPGAAEHPAAPPEAGAAGAGTRRRRLLIGAKVAVSAGLLYWLLAYKLDVREAAHQLAAIRPWFLVAAFALACVCYGLITLRWQAILFTLGLHIDLRRVLVISWIGQFFNQVLPANVGGDFIRVWRVLRHGSSLGRAASSVMIDRLMALAAIVVLVLFCLPLSARMIDGPAFWALPVLVGIGVVGLAALMGLDRLVVPLRRLLPGRLAAYLDAIGHDMRATFVHGPRSAAALSYALINQLAIVMDVYVLALGLGVGVGIVDVLVLFPPVLLLSMLPISFAGWGVRELAMVTAFGFVGVPAGQSGALSIAFGLVLLVSALPGGVLWFIGSRRQGVAGGGRA